MDTSISNPNRPCNCVKYEKAILPYGTLQSEILRKMEVELHEKCSTVLSKIKHWKEAKRHVECALRLCPKHVKALFRYASVLGNLKMIPQAEVQFTKVFELVPSYGRAHNNMGVMYMENAQFDKAEECFHKAAKFLGPDKGRQIESNFKVLAKRRARMERRRRENEERMRRLEAGQVAQVSQETPREPSQVIQRYAVINERPHPPPTEERIPNGVHSSQLINREHNEALESMRKYERQNSLEDARKHIEQTEKALSDAKLATAKLTKVAEETHSTGSVTPERNESKVKKTPSTGKQTKGKKNGSGKSTSNQKSGNKKNRQKGKRSNGKKKRKGGRN